MHINTTTPIDVQQKQYLNSRAQTVFYDLSFKLPEQFNLNDDKPPQSLKDFKDRVAAGKFTLVNHEHEAITAEDWDDEEDKFRWGSLLDSLRWRDPARKADHAGRELADKELGKKLTETKDAIMIGEPAEGLKALQDLEKWVPTNLPS